MNIILIFSSEYATTTNENNSEHHFYLSRDHWNEDDFNLFNHRTILKGAGTYCEPLFVHLLISKVHLGLLRTR